MTWREVITKQLRLDAWGQDSGYHHGHMLADSLGSGTTWAGSGVNHNGIVLGKNRYHVEPHLHLVMGS